MALNRVTHRPKDSLSGARRRAGYNPAEREFSLILQRRLHDLLEGKRERLDLLRRYPNDANRLGVMATPASLRRDQLRLPVVEALIWETINFVRLKAAGGPVSQEVAAGGIVELQTFPTKFPHIVIERTDRYAEEGDDPIAIAWSLQRLQNQRTQTQINRFLDAANLVLDLARVVR